MLSSLCCPGRVVRAPWEGSLSPPATLHSASASTSEDVAVVVVELKGLLNILR
jgi:hypothetical protein